jgi:hypothetical protein
MRISDVLYFSPNVKFENLDWENKNSLIDAFEDRVNGFYFKPAEELNKDKLKFNAFAVGVLCATTIDFLARITILTDNVGDRIEQWLVKYITEFGQNDPNHRSKTLARCFYEDYRNGLVHEGRIKNCGQFSYECGKLVYVKDRVMIIDPDLLLEKTKSAFKSYMADIKDDNSKFQQLKCALIRDFHRDIECAKR